MKKLFLILLPLLIIISSSCEPENNNLNEIEDWQEMNISASSNHVMKFPTTYSFSNIFFGDDSWVFHTQRNDQKSVFNYEQNALSPPILLVSPLPNDYLSYDIKEIIYSIYDPTVEVGVLYYKIDINGSFRNGLGIYFNENNNEYEKKLYLSFASSELEEVKTILSTVQ